MSNDKNVSQRIAILRFVMIFGVIVLHTPLYVPIAEVGNDAFGLTKAFFQQALFRSSVSVLTFIAGYLMFVGGTSIDYAKLLRKKFKSLVVPFALFNLGMLALAYVAEVRYGFVSSTPLVNATFEVWANKAIGLADVPVNYPLNFLRDMIVLMVLVPVIGWMLRVCPMIGLLFVTMFFIQDYDGLLILRADMAITFYMGGLAATSKIDMLSMDRFAWPALAALITMCLIIVALKVSNTTALRMVAPALIWPAASLVVNTKVGALLARLSRYSFFMFLAHAPVLLLTYKLYERVAQDSVPYPVYWTTAPVIVTLVLIGVYRGAMFLAPSVFGVMLGCRTKVKTTVSAVAVPA